MKRSMYSILAVALMALIQACDSSTSNNDTDPGQTPYGPTGGLTCLEAKGARLPSGTYAKRVSTGEKAYLDANGCFSMSKASALAGRIAAAGDSIQFYNDSALFSVTIPYQSQGDTINVVPTIVSLKNCPKKMVDSVFLVVFDRIHIMSRRVKMKRADYPNDSSEFGRTIWSVESSNPFKIHFEVHDSASWPSAIITAEPGGTVSMNYSQIGSHDVLMANIPDTLFFFSRAGSYCIDTSHTTGGQGDTCMSADSAALTSRIGMYRAGKSVPVVARSAYGVADIKIDGVKANSVSVPKADISKTDTTLESKVVSLSVIDSAGYALTKKITVFKSMYFNGQVSDSIKAATIECYVSYASIGDPSSELLGSTYAAKVYGYKK